MTETGMQTEKNLPSRANELINKWAANLDGIDDGAESNGFTKQMVVNELNQHSSTFSPEQQAAANELAGMSLKTGIDTRRVRELARLF